VVGPDGPDGGGSGVDGGVSGKMMSGDEPESLDDESNPAADAATKGFDAGVVLPQITPNSIKNYAQIAPNCSFLIFMLSSLYDYHANR